MLSPMVGQNNSVDKQLVERVRRGDKRAFDLLILKYQHKIILSLIHI